MNAEIAQGYAWLGHNGAFTELNALPQEGETYPRIAYATTAGEVCAFARHYPDHLVCYSLNPRPKAFTTKHGYRRSARESEIEVAVNILFDFDFKGLVTKRRVVEFQQFLSRCDVYCRDHGLAPPSRAFSGGGYHALFAHPPVQVRRVTDYQRRLRAFRAGFAAEFRQELSHLETVLDRTQDLRRMLKAYGTAKKGHPTSRFLGGTRREDPALVEYLLSLPLPKDGTGVRLAVARDLPSWFPELLENDSSVRDLWHGTGKPAGQDTSRTGYDFSLALVLLRRGQRNLDELATILALRPEGAVRKSGKDPDYYVRRTITKALGA